jgi:hypothetical protein
LLDDDGRGGRTMTRKEREAIPRLAALWMADILSEPQCNAILTAMKGKEGDGFADTVNRIHGMPRMRPQTKRWYRGLNPCIILNHENGKKDRRADA